MLCLVSEMGLLGDSEEGGKGKGSSWGGGGVISSLIRRKQVDSVHAKSSAGHQLAKALSVPHLIAIGNSFSFNFGGLSVHGFHLIGFCPCFFLFG